MIKRPDGAPAIDALPVCRQCERIMAKDFAKQFYRSKEWQKARTTALMRDHYMCQICKVNPAEEVHHTIELTPRNINDPDITLNIDRLVSVCRECHFKEHRKKRIEAAQKAVHARVVDERGMYFDEDGQMQKRKIYFIWGAPASGKTTYVKEHKQDKDIVVDLDSIREALGGERYKWTNLLDLSLSIRDYIYDKIEAEDQMLDARAVWVIETAPNRQQREDTIQRLHAQEIHIDTDIETCIERARSDPEREDKMYAVAIIEQYFERLQR